MSETAGMSGDPAPPQVTMSRPPAPRRSWLAGVVRETVGRRGAVMGLVWLGVIAFSAVFAPLLASSHPLALKTTDGVVSSPWLRHLDWVDVTLLVCTAAALVIFLWPGPRRIARRTAVLLLVIAAVTATCLLTITTPLTVNYEHYRQLHRDNKVAWAIYTPVPYSPTDRLRDTPEARLNPPSSEHLLGTEENGADVLSRMIHACRIALAVGFISTSIALVLGVAIGGLMGYFSRSVDLLGMRLVEIFEAIPQLYLLLAFVAFFPRNLYIMMAIIGFTGWTGYARFTRAEFLRLRRQDFVQAAIACGLPLRSILFRHMLPNGVAPVLVTASFGVASAILAESFLSFLGLGLVDEPSWGQMLSQAISPSGGFSWWIATYPTLAIFLTVFAYNLVGEALRDAIDPHLRKSAHL